MDLYHYDLHKIRIIDIILLTLAVSVCLNLILYLLSFRTEYASFYLIIFYLILFATILFLIYICYSFFKINIILGYLSIFILLLLIIIYFLIFVLFNHNFYQIVRCVYISNLILLLFILLFLYGITRDKIPNFNNEYKLIYH